LSPPASELANAVVFARVRSWATGRRLVSLPFSDHCEPLVDCDKDSADILEYACWKAADDHARLVEVRPLSLCQEMLSSQVEFEIGQTFMLHRLDLRPGVDDLFRRMHKDCVQRKIRRAEREGLQYIEGRSEALLQVFFELLLKTRRKHRVPPQPIAWFRSLINFLGDNLKIRAALKNDRPIAAIMTIEWNDTLVYKYGCSDPEFSNLGGTPMVFWKAIQSAKTSNLNCFDLGRSDSDNTGLIAFKDHWGAGRSELRYFQHPAPRPRLQRQWMDQVAGYLVSRMPDRLLVMAGKLLYPHIG
jgi:hypothetical protein